MRDPSSATFRNVSLLARPYFFYSFPVIGDGDFRKLTGRKQLKGFLALLFPIKCRTRRFFEVIVLPRHLPNAGHLGLLVQDQSRAGRRGIAFIAFITFGLAEMIGQR